MYNNENLIYTKNRMASDKSNNYYSISNYYEIYAHPQNNLVVLI